MTFDDWSIFCKYNHRVRSLRANRYPVADTEIWHNLSCPPFLPPLLPNLVSLMWKSDNTELFSYMWLFATPKLRRLDIFTKTFDPSEHSVFSLISMLCPSVSHFNFNSIRNSADTSTALQRWSHLTSVITREVSEAAILHLFKLPSLRVLEFHLPPTPMSANTKKLLQCSKLCALQELTVSCSSLVLIDAFFEDLFIAPKLISFRIIGGMDSAGALLNLICRVSDTCAHNSLEQIRLTFIDLLAGHNTSIGLALFKPLFAFHNLRKLDFDAEYGGVVRWNDYVLLEMAQAWPLLEELQLNKFSHSNHSITPDTFVSLLQHCPRLVSVAVIINWTTIDRQDISSDVPYQGFAHKELSRAFFGSPRIHHPARIAAFISAVAPKVKEILSWIDSRNHRSCEKHLTRWKVVEDLVKCFSKVREQQRRLMLMTGEGVDNHRINLEGLHNHIGIAHPVQESENRDAVVGGGGEVYDDSGNENDSEYVSSDEGSEEEY